MPGILTPLRDRNFALFAFATATSMLGDGIALVAIAWQVYSLSDSATALGLVLTAWTLAQVPVSLIGGVAGDRMDRRRLLIASDVARCVIFVLIGVLALTDHLSLPGFVAIGMLYGLADGIYAPVAGAIIPDIVRADALVPANSLLGVLRPMSLRLLGPAAGGLIIAVAGTGGAFLVNAGTFAASGAALLLMRASDIRSVQPGDPDAAAADPEEGPVQALVRDVRESLGYVRQNPWLARSMLAATFVLIFYWGPLEVLVPYLAKHELGHGAGGLGVILACGGLGSMLASILVGQRGLPSRPLAFMYACWIVGCAVMAAYALADGLVLASAVAFVTFGIMTASWVAQAVVMQQQVPQHLLGRVTSFDWLLSSAAAPIGFAAVGPVADAIGTRETFAWMGLAGVVATALLLPRSGARTIRLRDEAEDAPAAAEATAQG